METALRIAYIRETAGLGADPLSLAAVEALVNDVPVLKPAFDAMVEPLLATDKLRAFDARARELVPALGESPFYANLLRDAHAAAVQHDSSMELLPEYAAAIMEANDLSARQMLALEPLRDVLAPFHEAHIAPLAVESPQDFVLALAALGLLLPGPAAGERPLAEVLVGLPAGPFAAAARAAAPEPLAERPPSANEAAAAGRAAPFVLDLLVATLRLDLSTGDEGERLERLAAWLGAVRDCAICLPDGDRRDALRVLCAKAVLPEEAMEAALLYIAEPALTASAERDAPRRAYLERPHAERLRPPTEAAPIGGRLDSAARVFNWVSMAANAASLLGLVFQSTGLGIYETAKCVQVIAAGLAVVSAILARITATNPKNLHTLRAIGIASANFAVAVGIFGLLKRQAGATDALPGRYLDQSLAEPRFHSETWIIVQKDSTMRDFFAPFAVLATSRVVAHLLRELSYMPRSGERNLMRILDMDDEARLRGRWENTVARTLTELASKAAQSWWALGATMAGTAGVAAGAANMVNASWTLAEALNVSMPKLLIALGMGGIGLALATEPAFSDSRTTPSIVTTLDFILSTAAVFSHSVADLGYVTQLAGKVLGLAVSIPTPVTRQRELVVLYGAVAAMGTAASLVLAVKNARRRSWATMNALPFYTPALLTGAEQNWNWLQAPERPAQPGWLARLFARPPPPEPNPFADIRLLSLRTLAQLRYDGDVARLTADLRFRDMTALHAVALHTLLVAVRAAEVERREDLRVVTDELLRRMADLSTNAEMWRLVNEITPQLVASAGVQPNLRSAIEILPALFPDEPKTILPWPAFGKQGPAARDAPPTLEQAHISGYALFGTSRVKADLSHYDVLVPWLEPPEYSAYLKRALADLVKTQADDNLYKKITACYMHACDSIVAILWRSSNHKDILRAYVKPFEGPRPFEMAEAIARLPDAQHKEPMRQLLMALYGALERTQADITHVRRALIHLKFLRTGTNELIDAPPEVDWGEFMARDLMGQPIRSDSYVDVARAVQDVVGKYNRDANEAMERGYFEGFRYTVSIANADRRRLEQMTATRGYFDHEGAARAPTVVPDAQPVGPFAHLFLPLCAGHLLDDLAQQVRNSNPLSLLAAHVHASQRQLQTAGDPAWMPLTVLYASVYQRAPLTEGDLASIAIIWLASVKNAVLPSLGNIVYDPARGALTARPSATLMDLVGDQDGKNRLQCEALLTFWTGTVLGLPSVSNHSADVLAYTGAPVFLP